MKVCEVEFEIPAAHGHRNLIGYLRDETRKRIGDQTQAIRFVVSKSDAQSYHCEVGTLSGNPERKCPPFRSIFNFERRASEDISSFNAVFLIPTGIGSTIGGHAGDATPAARLMAQICDRVILHPNVVNASDINEMPPNALYVEGSIITRLLMGTAGLRTVRANRILCVMDNHPEDSLRTATINTISAARATYGLRSDHTVLLEPPLKLSAHYAPSGRAVGHVVNFDSLVDVLERHWEEYDAVALATIVNVPPSYHLDYFRSHGEMINPWGGAEAILTHTVSCLFNVPAAHAPIMENEEIAELDPGLVDPRMAAEAISYTYFQCVLKGLRQSPGIVERNPDDRWPEGTLTASNVSCLIMPDKCLGLPTLAALEQGIPVIAVRENENILDNDLTSLPWAPGQLYIVDNYWEAAGVLAALKGGIEPKSVRRPLPDTVWSVETPEFCEAPGPHGAHRAGAGRAPAERP